MNMTHQLKEIDQYIVVQVRCQKIKKPNIATSPEKMDNEEPTWKLVLEMLDKIRADITELMLGQ